MMPTESVEKLDAREVYFRISGLIESLKLFLRHAEMNQPAEQIHHAVRLRRSASRLSAPRGSSALKTPYPEYR
jgi:hypothetical protein